jgi:hypothetical protein
MNRPQRLCNNINTHEYSETLLHHREQAKKLEYNNISRVPLANLLSFFNIRFAFSFSVF